MNKFKKVLTSSFVILVAFSISGCEDKNENVLRQIGEYEKSVMYADYYVPLPLENTGVHDEMSMYVNQIEQYENNDPSRNAANAINYISAIFTDTIDTNNRVAKSQTADVLDSENPLDVGLKYASNWSSENMQKIGEISDEKIALSKPNPNVKSIDDPYNHALKINEDLNARLGKLYSSQIVYKPSPDEFINYYDQISRSLL